MTKVFVSVTMSLDGFIAPAPQPDDPGLALDIANVVSSPGVTHLSYDLRRGDAALVAVSPGMLSQRVAAS